MLRRLSTNVVDLFDGAAYYRLVGDAQAPTLLCVRQIAPDALGVVLDGPASAELDPAALAAHLLGLAVDPRPFERAARTTPWLARLVTGARGVRPPRYPTLWEAAVNAIVFQQVSIHAAAAILRRTLEVLGPPVAIPAGTIRAFPPPEAFSGAGPAALRSAGLSAAKIAALASVADAIGTGRLDERSLDGLPTPILTAALAEHRGIGPWTAAVIALRGFGRLDVFPMNDSGVAKNVRDFAGGAQVDVTALLAGLGAQRGLLYYHLLLGRLAARGEVELAATAVGL